MNRALWWTAVTWATLGIGAIVAAARPGRPEAGTSVAASENADTQRAASRDPSAAVSRAVVGRDLFRFDRRPATQAYDPLRGTAPPPPVPAGPPPAPKPVLSLVGIIGGDFPQAILEGLPGSSGGRAVRVGDVIGALNIMAIQGDTVRISGLDTVWVLTVREPWRK